MTDFYTPEKDKSGLTAETNFAEDLPKVFLIGDSISGGYTKGVIESLQGECNVSRAPDNCGDTRRGLEKLESWIGQTSWDLIHFNWGLHDLCYRHPEATIYGNRDKERGEISVPLEQYKDNLESLVLRLKKLAPKLIWASTTYVPEGEAGRFQGDDLRYNEAAAEIMLRHSIPTNDLHTLSAGFSADLFTCPGDVHFTDEGSRRLAKAVADSIRKHLNED